MKENYSNRKKKIARYSALAGSVVAATGAQAQIVYTDITDQVVTTGNFYNLDLNNDSNIDYVFGAVAMSGSFSGFSYNGLGVGISTAGSNGIMATAGSAISYADTLNLYQLIDNTGNFAQAASSASSFILMGAQGTINGVFPFSLGYWLGVNDRYVGAQFMIGANTHYGWARLSVAANASSFTIKDYAYHSTPNTPILAGSTGAASVENFDLSKSINLNLANNNLKVSVLNPELTNGSVEIIDLSGKVAKTATVNGNTNIDLSGFASGMYVVRVTFDQGQMSEKLFVR